MIATIDDDPFILDATTMLMEASGMQVYAALDRDVAMNHVEAGVKLDIVISDYRLAEFTGVEVIQQVRSVLLSELPTIILTGDTSAREINAANLSNCTVLHKPTNTDRLISIIDQIVP